MIKSMLSVEKESHINLHSFSKELKFFRDIIIDGHWE